MNLTPFFLVETPSATAVREALRNLKAAIDKRVDSARTENLEAIRSRMDGLVEAAQELTDPELQVTVTLTPSIPHSGFESPTTQRLVVGFGRDDAPMFLGLAFFRQTEGNIDTRAPNPVE